MEKLEKKVVELENIMKMVGLASKEVLSFEEAATYMGLSKSSLYRSTSLQIIPHYKPNGKMIFFNRVELEQWLQRNRVKTTEEIQQEAQIRCFKSK
jgi:excisionase family DNA binding protein